MRTHFASKQPRILLIGAAALVALAVSAPAFAAPGGGGGGSSMSSSQSRTINPAESYREGLEALEAGDYRKAEKKFGEVLAAAPNHPQANYFMGMAKVGRGQEKSARRYFERAVEGEPNFVDAREQLALVYISTGDVEKAQEQLAALKDIQSKCAAASCSSAAVVDAAVAKVEAALGGGGEGGEDVGALEGADRFAGLFLKPREEGVDLYRGAVRLINEERYEAAIVELYEAQGIVGPHPDIYNYLGYSNRKLGRFDKAKEYYAQALALDPDHLGATEYLGELYLETGETAKARRQLARLDELCAFGCAEREDLARLIDIKESVRRAGK